MKTLPLQMTTKKGPLEHLAHNITVMNYKRMQVRNRQFMRNLLKNNQQLLKGNNINTLILF